MSFNGGRAMDEMMSCNIIVRCHMAYLDCDGCDGMQEDAGGCRRVWEGAKGCVSRALDRLHNTRLNHS